MLPQLQQFPWGWEGRSQVADRMPLLLLMPWQLLVGSESNSKQPLTAGSLADYPWSVNHPMTQLLWVGSGDGQICIGV